MKGKEELLTVLNTLLAEELAAINKYMIHSEMFENWGYGKLYRAIRNQALNEMQHAELLIERILFFEGTPMVSILNPMKIGNTVPEMISNDNGDETNTVRAYNDAIKLAHEVGDQGTVELLSKILKMEEDHVDWAAIQRALINQMGLEIYLVSQVDHLSS